MFASPNAKNLSPAAKLDGRTLETRRRSAGWLLLSSSIPVFPAAHDHQRLAEGVAQVNHDEQQFKIFLAQCLTEFNVFYEAEIQFHGCLRDAPAPPRSPCPCPLAAAILLALHCFL